jgi:hypothetical protein
MNENERNNGEVNPDIVSMTEGAFQEKMRNEILPSVIKQVQEAADAGKIKSIKQDHPIHRIPKEESEDGLEHLVTDPIKTITIEIVTGEQEREKVNPEGMEETVEPDEKG